MKNPKKFGYFVIFSVLIYAFSLNASDSRVNDNRDSYSSRGKVADLKSDTNSTKGQNSKNANK